MNDGGQLLTVKLPPQGGRDKTRPPNKFFFDFVTAIIILGVVFAIFAWIEPQIRASSYD